MDTLDLKHIDQLPICQEIHRKKWWEWALCGPQKWKMLSWSRIKNSWDPRMPLSRWNCHVYFAVHLESKDSLSGIEEKIVIHSLDTKTCLKPTIPHCIGKLWTTKNIPFVIVWVFSVIELVLRCSYTKVCPLKSCSNVLNSTSQLNYFGFWVGVFSLSYILISLTCELYGNSYAKLVPKLDACDQRKRLDLVRVYL